VFLRAFFIDRYEVTVEQYRKCVDEEVCTPIRVGRECTMYVGNDEKLPVNCVGWKQAVEYCQWTGGRLPTEAEWEKAATYGLKNGELPNYRETAWYSETSDDWVHPVGTKKPNAIGLYDMVGNVWEWCSDWYAGDYYRESPPENPMGPQKGRSRVIRGGGYQDRPCAGARITSRIGSDPNYGDTIIGFRCAAD